MKVLAGRVPAGLGGGGGLAAGVGGLWGWGRGWKKMLLAGWVGGGLAATGVGLGGGGLEGVVGAGAGRDGVGLGVGGLGAGVCWIRTEPGSGKESPSNLICDPGAAPAVGRGVVLNAVKGVGLAPCGTGVGEKEVLTAVGGGGRAAGRGVAVGGWRPEGAAALLSLISPEPPATPWRSSVWKVPVAGLKTSSLEKLGPTGVGEAAGAP